MPVVQDLVSIAVAWQPEVKAKHLNPRPGINPFLAVLPPTAPPGKQSKPILVQIVEEHKPSLNDTANIALASEPEVKAKHSNPRANINPFLAVSPPAAPGKQSKPIQAHVVEERKHSLNDMTRIALASEPEVKAEHSNPRANINPFLAVLPPVPEKQSKPILVQLNEHKPSLNVSTEERTVAAKIPRKQPVFETQPSSIPIEVESVGRKLAEKEAGPMIAEESTVTGQTRDQEPAEILSGKQTANPIIHGSPTPSIPARQRLNPFLAPSVPAALGIQSSRLPAQLTSIGTKIHGHESVPVRGEESRAGIAKVTELTESTVPAKNIQPKPFERTNGTPIVMKRPPLTLLFEPSVPAVPSTKKYLPTLTEAQKNEFRDACVAGSPADLVAILEKGVILVDDPLEHSWSGLQHACYRGRADNVKALLLAGADPNFKRFDEMTVLMAAACSTVQEDSLNGPLECAKLVHEAGGRLDSLHEKSITALIFATKRGHFKMVTYFLQHLPAPIINHRDVNTRSALDWAAFLGKPKVARVLLEYGAEVLDTNRFGQTPSEVAALKGFSDIADTIHKAQVTKWRPGKDPHLAHVGDKKNLLKRAELNKARRLTMIKTYEQEQLEMILKSLQLQRLGPLFKKHRITYLDFLRLRDVDFLDIGVTNPAERCALVRTIRETSKSIFTDDSRKPLRIPRNLAHHEILGILGSTLRQLRRLKGTRNDTGNNGITKLHQLLVSKPEGLEVGCETGSISELRKVIADIVAGCNRLIEDIDSVRIVLRCPKLPSIDKTLDGDYKPQPRRSRYGRFKAALSQKNGIKKCTMVVGVGSLLIFCLIIFKNSQNGVLAVTNAG